MKLKWLHREHKQSEIRTYLTGLVTGALFCLAVLLILQFVSGVPVLFSSSLTKEVAKKTQEAQSYIDKYYWKSDLDQEKLADYAIKGMVSALGDKYSDYYTTSEYNQAMGEVKGDYTGIGATIYMDTSTKQKIIRKVQKSSPAEEAGLKVDDVLLKINGEDISQKSLNDTVSMIRGKEGKTSKLTIQRKEQDKTKVMEVTVTAKKLVNQSIHYKMLTGKKGYINISNFDNEGVKQFQSAMEDLKKQGMTGLVLDVRNNGGGSLEAVTKMLDELLPEGVLLTEKYKNKEDVVYRSTDEKQFDKPMVVLINGGSASASEVMAGALQDRKAATLVGVKSFGKGIVQSIFSLRFGGGIKLTTGQYLLPSGRCIHGTGLTPDVEVTYSGTSNELGGEDDNQLQKALTVLEK